MTHEQIKAEIAALEPEEQKLMAVATEIRKTHAEACNNWHRVYERIRALKSALAVLTEKQSEPSAA